MKIFMASLGCDKNLVDSEEMLGLLAAEGFSVTDDEREAEVIIVNTCAFIGDAKEESIRTILELSAFKKEAGNAGKCLALLVTGCLAERYHEEFKKELPEVDAVVGTGAWDRIVPAVKECLAGKSTEMLSKDHHIIPPTGRRMLSTGGHFAYMKIAEGCDKRCTYCIIPTLRGSYHSVPLEELTAEAERLAGQGVKELILVAQETTVYGVDLYGEKALPRLLRELSRIDGIRWIRLMYCYPEEIT
ncbi:MAG: radical SAM protein, partial [Lachnospiraceae bacterium]|nr:radical SAM protein [Lachnospiraceae bacterium]